MNNKEDLYINISAPNLVNICVDKSIDGEITGRIFDCYHKTPFLFNNLINLLRWMESFFDNLSYPQAATITRNFGQSHIEEKKDLKKLLSQEDIIQNRGEKGTFVTWVQYRQNSSWQGETVCMEKMEKYRFASTLDLVKIIDAFS
ncbi:MAG: hypothetical protein PUH88_09010 [Lachnospiraceae bacterium]|nr:hypothetical protein [Lachnospiraceae bacterium]